MSEKIRVSAREVIEEAERTGGDILFSVGEIEMLRLCSNGDIYVKGRLTTNDLETVEGFKEFVLHAKSERLDAHQ